MHLEERCRKSMENHVSFVTRNLRSDSATTVSSSSSMAVFGGQQQQQPDGAYTPDDSDMESGGDDDERTIVAAEKAEGLFRTDDDGDWRRRVDEEIDDLKADAEKPLDEILTVLPREYVDAIGSSSGGIFTRPTPSAATDDDSDDDDDDDNDDEEDGHVSGHASSVRLGILMETADSFEDDEEEDEEEQEEAMEEETSGEFLSADSSTSLAGREERGEEDINKDDWLVQSWKSLSEKDCQSGQDKWVTEAVQTASSLHPKADHDDDDDDDDEDLASSLPPDSSSSFAKTKNLLLFRGTLREYQRRGVGWLRNAAARRLGAVLADEKGNSNNGVNIYYNQC